MREYHVRFRERFGGETPPYLLDMWHPAYDKKFKNIYQYKPNMYRLSGFIYKRLLPLYIKSHFLYITGLI